MSKKINFSKEEDLIIKILFDRKINDIKIFDKINFDKIVKIASSELILPTIYVKLKVKKLLEKFPDELINYLKKIYLLNRERNRNLISESQKISEILNSNKINHIFIKGAAYIMSDIYEDYGERMIGDIDILVEDQDIKKCKKILIENGYKKHKFSFYSERHLPRMIHENKIFALEIHNKLFDKKNQKINIKNIMNKRIKINNIYVGTMFYQFLYNIYSFQINDVGSAKLNFSIRNIYDSYRILNEGNINVNEIIVDKEINNYFLYTNIIGITKINLIDNFRNKINFKRIKLKRELRYYNRLENFVVGGIYKLKKRPKQLAMFLKDKNYRKYICNKIFMKN